MDELFEATFRRIKLVAVMNNCVPLIAVCSLIYISFTAVVYMRFSFSNQLGWPSKVTVINMLLMPLCEVSYVYHSHKG
jgi:hypothetical protein